MRAKLKLKQQAASASKAKAAKVMKVRIPANVTTHSV
jgi:hypothetical protein